MHFKDLNVLAAAVILFCASPAWGQATPTEWDLSPVGQCQTGFTKKFAADREENPDLVKRKAGAVGQDTLLWVIDSAPSRNQTRTLYRVDKSDKGCVVLHMPFADTHDFRLTKAGQLPPTVKASMQPMTNAEGVTESIHFTYKLEASGQYSRYPECRKRVGASESIVPCREVAN